MKENSVITLWAHKNTRHSLSCGQCYCLSVFKVVSFIYVYLTRLMRDTRLDCFFFLDFVFIGFPQWWAKFNVLDEWMPTDSAGCGIAVHLYTAAAWIAWCELLGSNASFKDNRFMIFSRIWTQRIREEFPYAVPRRGKGWEVISQQQKDRVQSIELVSMSFWWNDLN